MTDRPGRGRGVARVFLALGALAVTLAVAPPAAAQYFGQNKVQYRTYDWQWIRSDHFEIYFYPELDSLARRVLDLAEKTDAMLTERLGHSLTRRIPIILYGSHNDFSQTNVTSELIDPGTGGFTEVLRNRVVLPFTGSYEDLRHVVVHELVHAYMFDLLYGGTAGSMIARQSFYSAPLWFAEGLAEYISLGTESNAEMFVRDGTIVGYMPPLMYSGGYLVYKQGQSAIAFLVERFGEDRLRDLLQRIRMMRSFDRAFQRSLGMPVSKFDEHWRVWLRKRYWPTVATKEDPERFARRLTDHRRDQSNFNNAPAISPLGDRVAYISDRKQYTDIYLMSAIDGKVLRRVIRGERSIKFESIPLLRSALTWSPDGRRLALVAKSGGEDRVYVVEVATGRVLQQFSIGSPSLAYPAWSPVGDSLVVVGVVAGRADLFLIRLTDGQVVRLTDDTHDEKDPAWAPDGRSIAFSSDRVAPVVLHPLRQERGFGAYGLFQLQLDDLSVTEMLDTHGDDHAPAWSSDGGRLAFISDYSGTPNVYLYDLSDSTVTQLTDVQGGVTSLSWSRHNDRLVFAAFNRGGFDVFAVREPLSADSVVQRLRRNTPASVSSLRDVRQPPEPEPEAPILARGALAIAWPESLTTVADSTVQRARPSPSDSLLATRSAFDAPVTDAAYGSGFADPAWPDTGGRALPRTSTLVDNGGPFAVSDTVLGQPAARYRGRLSPEFAGAGFYASTVGVVGASQFLFSDFLGNHSLFVATDVFSNNLSETNAMVAYSYLPRRLDMTGGLFHFKNYFSSDVTTLGEQLGAPRLFSERNFGVLVSGSYPFNRFRRVELGFIQMFVERTFFQEINQVLLESGTEYRSVSSPTLSVVGDNTLFGYYGPTNGARYNLTFGPSFAWFNNGLAYRTLTLDMRRYWDMTRGYTVATRFLGGFSDGRDPQAFQIGGFSTVRGYPDFDTHGSRIAILNTELRFPFIQELGLVGPVPLGVFNLRGATFADVGMAWNAGYSPRLWRPGTGGQLQDLMFGFGVGARTSFSFMILKLDVAWRSDLQGMSEPRWHFSIGPEF